MYSSRDLLRELPIRYRAAAVPIPAEELLAIAASSYASRSDRSLTPQRRRMASELQRAYLALAGRGRPRGAGLARFAARARDAPLRRDQPLRPHHRRRRRARQRASQPQPPPARPRRSCRTSSGASSDTRIGAWRRPATTLRRGPRAPPGSACSARCSSWWPTSTRTLIRSSRMRRAGAQRGARPRRGRASRRRCGRRCSWQSPWLMKRTRAAQLAAHDVALRIVGARREGPRAVPPLLHALLGARGLGLRRPAGRVASPPSLVAPCRRSGSSPSARHRSRRARSSPSTGWRRGSRRGHACPLESARRRPEMRPIAGAMRSSRAASRSYPACSQPGISL